MDDTILYCGVYYNNCKDKFVNYSHKRTGLPTEFISKLLNDIDVACTVLPDGFSKYRFPRSFAATSTVLDVISGNKIDEDAAEYSYFIGESVFHAEYEPFDNAIETLKLYKDAGLNLFMCTKGDYEIQNRKLDKHKLYSIFRGDRIYIVPKKTPSVIRNILVDNDLNAHETIMIGDSIRDDVGSACEAGIDAVHVTCVDNSWAYENTNHSPTYTIKTISELPKIIPLP